MDKHLIKNKLTGPDPNGINRDVTGTFFHKVALTKGKLNVGAVLEDPSSISGSIGAHLSYDLNKTFDYRAEGYWIDKTGVLVTMKVKVEGDTTINVTATTFTGTIGLGVSAKASADLYFNGSNSGSASASLAGSAQLTKTTSGLHGAVSGKLTVKEYEFSGNFDFNI